MNLYGIAEAAVGLTYGAWALAELWILARDSRRVKGQKRDRGSLQLIVWSIGLSLAIAWAAAKSLPQAAIPLADVARWVGVTMMWLGLSLRVWAVSTLGRYFRRTVVIQDDHELVEAGPYKVLRHPSYTGFIFVMTGLGLGLDNWVAAAVLTLGVTLPFLVRIRAEEAALSERFGQAWTDYARRTWALAPGLW